MIYHVTVGGRDFEVDVCAEGVLVDGRRVDADLFHAESSPLTGLHLDRSTFPLVAKRATKGRWRVQMRGSTVDVEVVDERTKAIRDMVGIGASPAGPRPIVAPMPGLVLRVEVAEGDRVDAGQGVVIVEAMKMENELRALSSGTVTRVHITEGQVVERDQVLMEFAAADSETA